MYMYLNSIDQVLNIHDFVMVLAPLVGETCQSAMLMEYLAMLCLLQSEMGQYSPSEIAASCLLLARLLLNYGEFSELKHCKSA